MPIAPSELSGAETLVSRLVEEHRANHHWELPPLVQETSWLDRLKEKLWDWFVGLFPKRKLETGFDFARLFDIALLILKVFVVLAFLTAVVWLIRTLIQAYRNRPQTLPQLSLGGQPEIPILWENELALALRENNLAAAARVRWRIFLRRLSLPVSLTPSEFFDRKPPMAPDLFPFYELMFFHSPPEARYPERFAEWSALLEAEERKT